MSISFIGKKYSTLSEDQGGTITTSIDFTFYFNAAESPVDVLAEDDVPALNSKHPQGNNLYANGRSVALEEGDGAKSGKYVVTVSYTNDRRINTQSRSDTADTAPWNLPPYDISIQPIDITKLFLKSYDEGNPSKALIEVKNPAGDPYESTIVDQNTLIKFSFNLRDFKDSWIDSYTNTVNVDTVTIVDKIIPAKKGRIRNLNASQQKIYEEDGTQKYKYWKVDVEIEKSPEEWKKEFVIVGLNFIDTGDSNKRKRIYTDNKGTYGSEQDIVDAGETATAVDVPVKLNADGSLNVDGAAVYDTYYDKPYINWKELNLPQTSGNR
jgi:hypothetical protein